MNENKNILVVDDDFGIRESLKEILESEGYKVECAEHGAQALQILLKESEKLPGLILLDMMMPVMDGKVFLATIESKYMTNFGSIPIIISSANANFLAEGFHLPVEKVNKPFDIDHLLDLVSIHYK